MGHNLLIHGIYWGYNRYNPFTNHLLASRDIQVSGFIRVGSPKFFLTNPWLVEILSNEVDTSLKFDNPKMKV